MRETLSKREVERNEYLGEIIQNLTGIRNAFFYYNVAYFHDLTYRDEIKLVNPAVIRAVTKRIRKEKTTELHMYPKPMSIHIKKAQIWEADPDEVGIRDPNTLNILLEKWSLKNIYLIDFSDREYEYNIYTTFPPIDLPSSLVFLMNKEFLLNLMGKIGIREDIIHDLTVLAKSALLSQNTLDNLVPYEVPEVTKLVIKSTIPNVSSIEIYRLEYSVSDIYDYEDFVEFNISHKGEILSYYFRIYDLDRKPYVRALNVLLKNFGISLRELRGELNVIYQLFNKASLFLGALRTYALKYA